MSKAKDQQRLVKAIEQELSWGPASSWHNSMFTELSELILDKCSVDLSIATLKRFFGTVKYEGAPSTTTLDALSQFVGYDNWRAFKLDKSTTSVLDRFKIPHKGIYLSIGFIAAFIVIVLFGTKRPPSKVDYEAIAFSSHPVTIGFPNSVIFDFDLNGVESDDMHIQQYWDPKRTISIETDQKQATGIYYYPGYFRARLFINGDTILQHDLFLKSDGWMGTIDYSPVPKYFKPIVDQESALSLPGSIATEVEASEDELRSSYHFVNNLGNVDADNFKLDVRLRTNYVDKWAVCQKAWVVVLTSKGVIFIPLSISGCSSDNSLRISETYVNGKTTDLSALSLDLSDYSTVSVVSIDKNVSITFDDNVVYTKKYTKPLGKVVGVRFEFIGHGEVRSFSLHDQNDNIVSLM